MNPAPRQIQILLGIILTKHTFMANQDHGDVQYVMS